MKWEECERLPISPHKKLESRPETSNSADRLKFSYLPVLFFQCIFVSALCLFQYAIEKARMHVETNACNISIVTMISLEQLWWW